MTARSRRLAVLLLAAAAFAAWWLSRPPRPPVAESHVDELFRPSPAEAVPCNFATSPPPFMLLALGQSNAGNHGASSPGSPPTGEATFFFEGRCYKTQGPAPGATGRDANLWTALSPSLERALSRPVVLAVLAVEGTRVAEWAEPGRLQRRLLATLADLRDHGFVPEVVVWQQGEADARAGTRLDDYRNEFSALIALLRREGITAPVLAGLSTRCRNEGSESVRSALKAVSRQDPTVRLGADSDGLIGSHRPDGCHFSAQGLQAVAELWWPIIVANHQ